MGFIATNDDKWRTRYTLCAGHTTQSIHNTVLYSFFRFEFFFFRFASENWFAFTFFCWLLVLWTIFLTVFSHRRRHRRHRRFFFAIVFDTLLKISFRKRKKNMFRTQVENAFKITKPGDLVNKEDIFDCVHARPHHPTFSRFHGMRAANESMDERGERKTTDP